MATLFDRDPNEVQWGDVEAFLQSRVAESDRLDYKLTIETDIADTLVAMANGDGGLIFLGVSEANQMPVDWPGLGGKDWLDFRKSQCGRVCAAGKVRGARDRESRHKEAHPAGPSAFQPAEAAHDQEEGRPYPNWQPE